MLDERSLGGNLNDAVRVGDTVRRRAGLWTPAVHALLRYLERAGFEAPRVLGADGRGREILQFIEGEAHSGTLAPLPDSILADAHIVEAAQLLRRYHDVVSGFHPPPDARWRMVAPIGSELICHNDWTPWNALLRKGRVEVMLDWDLAGPGTRIWDVANGIYCWAPLFASHLTPSLDVRLRRVRLFVDAYGLEDRTVLLPTLRSRLVFVGELVAREAAGGDVGMQRLVAMSVPKKMFEDDVGFLDRNWRAIESVL